MKVLIRWSKLILAVCCLLLGLAIFILPIPIGWLLILIGLALLVAESPLMQRWVKRRRLQNPKFDKAMRSSAPKLPKFLRHLIDLTDPQV